MAKRPDNPSGSAGESPRRARSRPPEPCSASADMVLDGTGWRALDGAAWGAHRASIAQNMPVAVAFALVGGQPVACGAPPRSRIASRLDPERGEAPRLRQDRSERLLRSWSCSRGDLASRLAAISASRTSPHPQHRRPTPMRSVQLRRGVASRPSPATSTSPRTDTSDRLIDFGISSCSTPTPLTGRDLSSARWVTCPRAGLGRSASGPSR